MPAAHEIHSLLTNRNDVAIIEEFYLSSQELMHSYKDLVLRAMNGGVWKTSLHKECPKRYILLHKTLLKVDWIFKQI